MTYCHTETKGRPMPAAKIAITIDQVTLRQVDRLVQSSQYPNRSKAIQEAVAEKLARIDRIRLARECAKLSIDEERTMAEEGVSGEVDQWPTY